jgi:NAD(P)-dependent dehydrogenase (short-subunit alcohol dehydrogenase family)
VGSPSSTAYNASKGAVRLFTKATALQHAGDGIRANSVHPGPTETDMLGLVFVDADAKEDRRGLIPAGRFGRPEDIAYGVLFLASDESSYMTGGELVIDGGYTAQ